MMPAMDSANPGIDGINGFQHSVRLSNGHAVNDVIGANEIRRFNNSKPSRIFPRSLHLYLFVVIIFSYFLLSGALLAYELFG